MRASGATRFLIDGFPRNTTNLEAWQAATAGLATTRTLFFLDCPEEVYVARVLHRGATSQRVDDNPESIARRRLTYLHSTMPVVERFRAAGRLRTIDASGTIDEVFAAFATELVVEFGDGVRRPEVIPSFAAQGGSVPTPGT